MKGIPSSLMLSLEETFSTTSSFLKGVIFMFGKEWPSSLGKSSGLGMYR
jgi:hypothetical protein